MVVTRRCVVRGAEWERPLLSGAIHELVVGGEVIIYCDEQAVCDCFIDSVAL